MWVDPSEWSNRCVAYQTFGIVIWLLFLVAARKMVCKCYFSNIFQMAQCVIIYMVSYLREIQQLVCMVRRSYWFIT